MTNKSFSFIGRELILIGYGLFLIIGILLAGKYTPYFLLAGIILPLLLYNFIENFSNLVLLYIVLLPFIQHFSFYAIKAGEFYITPHMVIQFIILSVVFFNFLYNYRAYQNKPTFFNKLLIALIIASIFSLIYPYSLPVDHTKRWLLFYTGIFENITFYFIILYLLKTEKDFTKKIIISIVISSLSALIIAFIEIRGLGFNLIKIFLARKYIGFGFHNTNLFGLYSALIFPLFFYVLTNKKYSSVRLVSLISFIVLSLLSVLCFNRGTFLVMVIELLFLFYIKANRKIIYLFIFAGLACAVYFHEFILLYIQRFIGGQGATKVNEYIDLSALYRLEAWKLAINLLFLFPFGLGAGGFQYAWERFGPHPEIYLGTPHELFLSIGVDYGIISMIIFIAILITSYYYCGVISKTKDDPASIFKYFRISLIGFVCYGVTTGGELSHLSGFIAPNNGYTLLLFVLFAIIIFHYRQLSSTKIIKSSKQSTPRT